jgi:hypothetical protein
MFQVKVVENIKTHILYSGTFFSTNRAIYEIMSKNVVEPERSQTIWHMRFACCISKAKRARARTHTHRNMQCLLLFRCNNSFVNVHQCYVLCVLPVLFWLPSGAFFELTWNFTIEYCYEGAYCSCIRSILWCFWSLSIPLQTYRVEWCL